MPDSNIIGPADGILVTGGDEAEIEQHVRAGLGRLGEAIERLSNAVPVVISLPTLPVAPAFHVPGWEAGMVMSCRAFSRRVEHGCIDLLFSRFDIDELRFDFTATTKHSPFRECFATFLGVAPEEPFPLRGLNSKRTARGYISR